VIRWGRSWTTKLLLLAVLPAAGIAGAAPAAAFSGEQIHAINAIVTAGKGASGTPGVVIGIADPVHGRYVHAYGTSDLTTQAPISLADHFRIASITKSFTATAILQLVHRHRLSLDAHLSDFVPGIRNGHAITIAELLNMTAGVYNYTEDHTFIKHYFAHPGMAFTTHDALAIIKAHHPAFDAGTRVAYSDSNYVLLELVADKVTGESLGALIKTQILDPVGLKHTSYPTTHMDISANP
jgi:D-alanyl-D-alanine carboxypeptidase